MMTVLLILYALVHSFGLLMIGYMAGDENLLDQNRNPWFIAFVIVASLLFAGLLSIIGLGVVIFEFCKNEYIHYRNNRSPVNETRFKNSCRDYLE